MNEKITSVEAYRQKIGQTKEIILPSGFVFKIRKISTRDYIQSGGLISAMPDSNAGEKAKILWERMPEEQKKQQLRTMSQLMVLAVIEPAMSMEKEKDKLCIDEMPDEDYYALLNEMTSFSYGGDPEKFFRKKGDDTDTGRSGEAIPKTPVGTAG